MLEAVSASKRIKPPGPREAAAVIDGAIAPDSIASRPSLFESIIAVAVVTIQGTAFIFVPMLFAGSSIDHSTFGQAPSPVNTIAVAANGLVVVALSLVHRRRVCTVVRGNWGSVLLAIVVMASTLWSIHPEITFRRSVGYLITILSTVYLASRFTTDQVMMVLSWSLALSAIGSIALVALYPEYGIMQDPYFYGAWTGVFPHKNVLGAAMTMGVFVECYILMGEGGGKRQHLALLGCFIAIVIFSHSATAAVCSAVYLVGTSGYVLWARASRIAAIASTATALLGLLAVVVVWVGAISLYATIGKDPTLSGRTEIWELVLDLVRQKPLLGWGYGAMWLADDSTTIAIVNAIGWLPPHAHNAILEIALELGSLGVAIVVAVVMVALWRGAACIVAGRIRLGAFMFMFFITLVPYSVVELTLAQNQSIVWVIFNILSFGAGLELARIRAEKKRSKKPIVKSIMSRAKPLAANALGGGDVASSDAMS